MKWWVKIKKWRIIGVIAFVSAVIAFILQISGVVNFAEFIDVRVHPVIIEPSTVRVSEAIIKQKTIYTLINRRNKIQKDVALAIKIPDCLTNANISISVDVEHDEFRSVKVGTDTSYLEFDPVAILEVETKNDGTYFFTAAQDFAPLQTQRISISISWPNSDYNCDDESYLSLEVSQIKRVEK